MRDPATEDSGALPAVVDGLWHHQPDTPVKPPAAPVGVADVGKNTPEARLVLLWSELSNDEPE